MVKAVEPAEVTNLPFKQVSADDRPSMLAASQAQSAGSIPVARSEMNPQVSGLGGSFACRNRNSRGQYGRSAQQRGSGEQLVLSRART